MRYLLRLGVLAACGFASTSGTAAAADTPRTELSPCRLLGFDRDALCGKLSRPLDPTRPSGPAVDIHFAVLPAVARNKKSDPVFFFAGGPGQSAIDLAGPVSRMLGRFSNRRDIVLVDQRGTGRSAPLKCDDDRPTRPLRESADLSRLTDAWVRCRQALSALPHGDLRQYTTTIAMQDADAVRRALGVTKINAIGGSYGTRAVLEYLRQFPQQVRRAVIDGVAPPDMVLPASFSTDTQAAFDLMLSSCAAEPGCAQAYPKLAEQWQALLEGLPRSVTMRNALTGKPETLLLQREHVVRAVRGPLYSPAVASALPAAIQAATQGDFNALGALASGVGSGRPEQRLAMGMHFSVICAEDLPRQGQTQDAPGKHFEQIDARLYAAACKNWPRGTVPPAFYDVHKAQSAVLVLSGGADPVTPPRHGERVAKALGALAKHEVVATAGHGVMGLPCVGDVLTRFIDAKTDAEALAVESSCAAKTPRPLAFIAPNPELPSLKASAP